MFTDEPFSADVVAVRDAVLVKFSKAPFARLMREYPEVVQEITKIVIAPTPTARTPRELQPKM